MSRVLQILFNTEMVRAILDGKKTVTRRVVKYKYSNTEMKMRTDKYGTRLIEIQKNVEGETHGKNPDGSTWHKLLGYIEPKPPYQRGDILYVRETWQEDTNFSDERRYFFKADEIDCMVEEIDWRPSIHMPKKAARIWLKVTDVRVERLQEITITDIAKEGFSRGHAIDETWYDRGRKDFANLWDSTLKKSDLDRYGWNANPWVWVIEFERCEKPKPHKPKGVAW